MPRDVGDIRLAGIVGVPASTVHRVLVRHGMNRLRWLDRPTGRPVRRIETTRPGELIHIDVKKLARVPDGGGHKMLGRSTETKRRTRSQLGYTHIHTAIDAYSRLAYSEFAGVENTDNCVAFLQRAVAWFTARGITIERILTDEWAYARLWRSDAARARTLETWLHRYNHHGTTPPSVARPPAASPTSRCTNN